MRSSQLDPKKLSDLTTMNPKSKEYDEDEADGEIKRGLDQFENKPKPNLSETQVVNLGTLEKVKEDKYSCRSKYSRRHNSSFNLIQRCLLLVIR